MKEKLKRFKDNKSGSSYLDIALMVVVAVMVIVLACNVFKYLTLKQDLDYIATTVAESAALVGGTKDRSSYGKAVGTDGSNINTGIQSTFKNVCASEGLSVGTGLNKVSLTVDVPDGVEHYDSSSGKVQLGEQIRVTVTCKTSFQGIGALGDAIPITCVSQKITLSRVYHKDID